MRYSAVVKGLVLAGGSGSRLKPITNCLSKQMIPIFDKPLIYYPISTLMLAGIREIVIVSTPEWIESFKKLLGTGEKFGVEFIYVVQDIPRGLPDAIKSAKKALGSSTFMMILGDNIFYGVGLGTQLKQDIESFSGARIFVCSVKDPRQFGVLELDAHGSIHSLTEKPVNPKSNLAITGLYAFDERSFNFCDALSPSSRGELEIVDLLNIYRQDSSLDYKLLPRGTAWLDTGTAESLIDASQYVNIVEKRQGLKIACLEEIAWRNHWIDDNQLMKLAEKYQNNPYATYLKQLL